MLHKDNFTGNNSGKLPEFRVAFDLVPKTKLVYKNDSREIPSQIRLMRIINVSLSHRPQDLS